MLLIIIITIGFFLIAAVLFLTVWFGVITDNTLQRLANVASVISLLVGIVIPIVAILAQGQKFSKEDATPLPKQPTALPTTEFSESTPTPLTPKPIPTPTSISPIKPQVTPIVKLRRASVELSVDETRSIFLSRDFKHRHYNPNGDFPNSYELQKKNGSEVVVDYATGLMWQQTGSPKLMTWDEAQIYISKELNSKNYAGCSHWRLPTLEELASLLEPTDDSKGGMFIDPIFGERSGYWTSDKLKGSDYIWCISFSHALLETSLPSGRGYYVMAVCSIR